MKNNLSGKTTILYVLALGIAGAYLGNTLDNYRKKKDNEK